MSVLQVPAVEVHCNVMGWSADDAMLNEAFFSEVTRYVEQAVCLGLSGDEIAEDVGGIACGGFLRVDVDLVRKADGRIAACVLAVAHPVSGGVGAYAVTSNRLAA